MAEFNRGEVSRQPGGLDVPSLDLKIGFVLLSPPDDPAPSTRVAALNLFPVLEALGHEPRVLFHPDQASEQVEVVMTADEVVNQAFDVVVFQKVHGESIARFASSLEALGIATIYLVCDLVLPAMTAVTSATIVVTDYLRSLYPRDLQHKVHVVHDGIERPDVFKAQPRPLEGSLLRPLRAVIVTSKSFVDYSPILGSLPLWLRLVVVGRFPGAGDRFGRARQHYWQWKTALGQTQASRTARAVVDPRIRCVAWDPEVVYRELLAADLGLIPVDVRPVANDPGWMVKSENRLTLMMAAGLPVIATPIPSYVAVVRNGENALLATDQLEWQRGLASLRDPGRRESIGRSARACVIERFSIARQARRFVEVLDTVRPPSPGRLSRSPTFGEGEQVLASSDATQGED